MARQNGSAGQIVRELQGIAAKVCGERVWRTLCKVCPRSQQDHRNQHGDTQLAKAQSEKGRQIAEKRTYQTHGAIALFSSESADSSKAVVAAEKCSRPGRR